MMLLVVQKHRDAVGCRHSDAHTRDVGHNGVDTLEQHLLDTVGQVGELLANDAALYTMCLVRHDDVVGVYAKLVGKQQAVGVGVGLAVSAILVDVERGIVALAHTSMTGCGERLDVVRQVVIVKDRLRVIHS